MVGIDLIVDSGTEGCAPARNRHRFVEADDIIISIQNRCYDQCLIVDIPLVEIDEERCFLFGDWASKISTVLSSLDWWSRNSEWILRVQRLVIEIEGSLPAISVCSRSR